MPGHILVSDPKDAVVTITLNRPEKKNALSIALRDEVSDALDALAKDAAAYTTLITRASRENLLDTNAKIIQRAGIAEGDTLGL